ncbi:MAG: hypothetical protein AAB611_01980, partial [Patescibacteria group bacterium]
MGWLAWLALFFVPFTTMFWVLIAFEFFLFLAFIEYEKGFWATVTMVGTLVGLQYFGDVPIVPYVMEHPFYTVAWVGGYFLFGTVWGIVKWWFFVTDNKGRYNQARAKFLQQKNITTSEIPENLKKEWKELASRGSYCGEERFVVNPLAYNYKRKIL